VFGLGPATRIYLAAGVTDMRKGFEELYGLVRDRCSAALVGEFDESMSIRRA
jgi:hypothetical protein